MPVVRRLLAQRHLAVMLCAATLLLRLLVPTGYMIGSVHGRLTIELCSGIAPRPVAARAMTMAMDVPGMQGHMPDHGGSGDHGKMEMPCAFSGLSAASLAAADPIQLVALIAFVMSVGFAGLALPPPPRRTYLRPPLRGPPAIP